MLREGTEIDPTWLSKPLVGLIFMAAAASGTYSKKAHKAQTEASEK